ncbi:trk system potassium uptake protein TrkA [Fervidobacterium gondwanense DSM 13020]|uniref:Trk system potassium uptake protein TrkA n=1 Tax=Fervidobacterium gondwanense DSM 13020 TaxID=1121883 RepID=A0A1M7RZI0_FERGO|nr:trk system potassium uptake protein TrkA [Fervidobacterium gondwanense DSM 13020]
MLIKEVTERVKKLTRTNLKFYVIVVGCGKIGLELATRLSKIGFNVTIIDKNPDALSLLPEDYGGFVIIGDATERETLSRAKAERADIIISTTEDDTTNYFISTVGAKIFGIPKVLSLVNNKENVELFEKSGIEVISPIHLAVYTSERRILEGFEVQEVFEDMDGEAK